MCLAPSEAKDAGGMARSGSTGASVRFTPTPRIMRPPLSSPMMPPSLTKWSFSQATRSLGHFNPRVTPQGSSVTMTAAMARCNMTPTDNSGTWTRAENHSPTPSALSQAFPPRPFPAVCASASTPQSSSSGWRARKACVESISARWIKGRGTESPVEKENAESTWNKADWARKGSILGLFIRGHL